MKGWGYASFIEDVKSKLSFLIKECTLEIVRFSESSVVLENTKCIIYIYIEDINALNCDINLKKENIEFSLNEFIKKIISSNLRVIINEEIDFNNKNYSNDEDRKEIMQIRLCRIDGYFKQYNLCEILK